MRLLIVLPGTERGGCEHYALNVAEMARQRGHEVSACLPLLPATATVMRDFERTGCKTHEWHCGSQAAPRWPTVESQQREANELLDNHRFDQIMLALPAPDSALGMLLACAQRQQRCVAVFQLCCESFTVPSGVRLACRTALLDRKLHLITVSRESVALLSQGLGIPPNHIHILHNTAGAAVPAIANGSLERVRIALGCPPEGKVMLTVARITKQKGYRTLVEAAARLRSGDKEAIFVWIGTGPGEKNLLQAIASAQLDDAFLLAGWRTDIGMCLRIADVFVLPSLWEGSPLALAEAMAHGCRIVATRVGGIPDLLGPDGGWLVPPDNPAALADAMTDALSDNSGRRPRNARNRWTSTCEHHHARLFALLENTHITRSP